MVGMPFWVFGVPGVPLLGAENTPLGSVPLLPLRDPFFALRECAKHLCLLEDHLVHEDRRCPDCIGKHCLTAEAFADEATQLGDKTGMGLHASMAIRDLWGRLKAGMITGHDAATEVRTLRKRAYAVLP